MEGRNICEEDEHVIVIWKQEDILWAPVLDDPQKPDLLQVVGDSRADGIDNLPVMAVGTESHVWLLHVLAERLEDTSEARVIELFTKSEKRVRSAVLKECCIDR
jgi:hypothetical protein